MLIGAHVQKDVRVVEWRARPHAVKLFYADENPLGTGIVGKMRNMRTGHETSSRVYKSRASPQDTFCSAAMVGDSLSTFRRR